MSFSTSLQCLRFSVLSAHELWESLYSYILIKLSPYQHLCFIMSLIAPFLLHKIPNICRFYPYFSMLFRFSIAICQLFVLLTVRPLNHNTTDAQRKPKKEWVGNHFQVVACSSKDHWDARTSKFGSWRVPATQIMQI